MQTPIKDIPDWIVDLEAESSVETIGSKAFNLTLLHKLGFAVPDCFFIPTFDPHRLKMKSTAEFLAAIEGLSRLLPLRLPSEPGWAVRSSATIEDLPGESHAGRFETVFITSPEEFTRAVEVVWESGATANIGAESMGVVVQKLIVEQFAANDGRRSLPYPGMMETLQVLKSQAVPMAVLTNKVEAAAIAQVHQTFGSGLFRAVRGLVAAERGKPDPTSLLELVAILGVEADLVAMVGDTEVDLQTARAACIGAIAVTWGFRDRAELEARAPDYLVETPHELLAILRIDSLPIRMVRCNGSPGLD